MSQSESSMEALFKTKEYVQRTAINLKLNIQRGYELRLGFF